MEAEERPSKMRKLSHDLVVEPPESSEQPISLTELDSPKNHERENSIRGELGGTQSDANAADLSDCSASINPDKLSRPSDMSKNAWKKIQKKAEWEAGREYRKVRRKEKTQAKKIRKRAAKLEADRKEGLVEPNINVTTTENRMRHIKLPVTFLIDCGFDNLMMEKERISLGSQLTRSYSDNTRAPFQAHLVVSSWGGSLKERFDTVLEKHYENWRGVLFTEKDFIEAAAIASENMKGPRGGEMAGAFEKYAAQQQRETGVVEHNIPINDQDSVRERLSTSNSLSVHSTGEQSSAKTKTNNNADRSSPAPHGQEIASLDDAEPRPPITDSSSQLDNVPSAKGEVCTLKPDANLSPTARLHADEGEIVYLTSDSPYTLDELKPYSTYIIGGLVDRNRHKGICYKTACERGLKTAKLPIGDFMEMRSRFVLATNHVVEIMVRWLECGDWGKAFLDVIPKRKGGKLKLDGVKDEPLEQDSECAGSSED